MIFLSKERAAEVNKKLREERKKRRLKLMKNWLEIINMKAINWFYFF